jgi:hypothetical protein
MILKYSATVFTCARATAPLLLLDDFVDDSVKGVGVGETCLAIEEQFARDNGLEMRAILTQQLLDYFELKVGMVLGRRGLLVLCWHSISALNG